MHHLAGTETFKGHEIKDNPSDTDYASTVCTATVSTVLRAADIQQIPGWCVTLWMLHQGAPAVDVAYGQVAVVALCVVLHQFVHSLAPTLSQFMWVQRHSCQQIHWMDYNFTKTNGSSGLFLVPHYLPTTPPSPQRPACAVSLQNNLQSSAAVSWSWKPYGTF